MISRTVAITQMITVVSQAMRESGTGVSWRTTVTAALPPESALAYVRELSTDVVAVVVLGPDGALLAGPPELAGPARAWLASEPEAPELADRTAAGIAFAARAGGHAVVAVASPASLQGPTALDVRTAVEALTGATPEPSAITPQSHGVAHRTDERLRAANALVSAAQSQG